MIFEMISKWIFELIFITYIPEIIFAMIYMTIYAMTLELLFCARHPGTCRKSGRRILGYFLLWNLCLTGA